MELLNSPGSRDGDLVGRLVAGDPDAFRDLLRRNDGRLRALAFRMLGDRHRMDDVLQDAYLRAYRALPTFRRDADVGSWLYRIVVNACLDEIRRARLRPVPGAFEEPGWDRPSAAPGPERSAVASAQLLDALKQLPPDQRAAVLLVDGEGFDYAGAGEILGVAPGTVASRLSRARTFLRGVMEEER